MSGNTSRTPILVAVVGIAVALLVVLNIFQQRNDPKYQEQMAKEQARKASEEAAKKQQEAQPPADAGAANELAAYGAEKTLGNPSGATKVTIGWNWTPAVQGDPNKVLAAATAASKALPNASVRVVNLDANPGAVPPGVTVDGKTVVPPGPDGSLPADAVSAALPAVAGAPGGPPPGPPPAAGASGPSAAPPAAPAAAP